MHLSLTLIQSSLFDFLTLYNLVPFFRKQSRFLLVPKARRSSGWLVLISFPRTILTRTRDCLGSSTAPWRSDPASLLSDSAPVPWRTLPNTQFPSTGLRKEAYWVKWGKCLWESMVHGGNSCRMVKSKGRGAAIQASDVIASWNFQRNRTGSSVRGRLRGEGKIEWGMQIRAQRAVI